jgi:hypothetical protein
LAWIKAADVDLVDSASSDRLGLLGIPVHPASLIRLAGGASRLRHSDYGRIIFYGYVRIRMTPRIRQNLPK